MNKSQIHIVNDLKELVKPYEKDQPYFRPFICDGSATSFDIFIIGINPATPIDEKDMDIDEYVKLLMNYDQFYKEYEKIRMAAGKPALSRTRKGTVSFVNELKRQTGKTVMETNVIPFPTSNIKELKKVPDNMIKQATEIFYIVLTEYARQR